MMISEKIFSQTEDILYNFFGQSVIITRILPKTETVYDDFRFVTKGFLLPNSILSRIIPHASMGF